MKNSLASVFHILLLFSLLPGKLIAQQFIYFRFTSDVQSIYSIQQVRKISFETNSVKLQLNDGTAYSWPATTIDHYKYMNDIPTDLKKTPATFNPWEVKVIPNPSEEKQVLRFQLPSSTDLELKIFDLNGKLILDRQILKLTQGEQELTLDWPGSRPGQYQLMLHTKEFSVSKKIIRR